MTVTVQSGSVYVDTEILNKKTTPNLVKQMVLLDPPQKFIQVKVVNIYINIGTRYKQNRKDGEFAV